MVSKIAMDAAAKIHERYLFYSDEQCIAKDAAIIDEAFKNHPLMEAVGPFVRFCEIHKDDSPTIFQLKLDNSGAQKLLNNFRALAKAYREAKGE